MVRSQKSDQSKMNETAINTSLNARFGTFFYAGSIDIKTIGKKDVDCNNFPSNLSENSLLASNPSSCEESRSDDDELFQKFRVVHVTRTLRRTVSESEPSKPLKGILKYTDGWKRRTMSESNTECGLPDLDFIQSINSLRLDESSDNGSSERERPKKSVSFCRLVSKATFRKDSTVQSAKSSRRRARKKAKLIEQRANERNRQANQTIDDSNMNENKLLLETGKDADNNIILDTRWRQDSGYDSEDVIRDSLSGETNNPNVVNTTNNDNNAKTNKKRRRKRKNRK